MLIKNLIIAGDIQITDKKKILSFIVKYFTSQPPPLPPLLDIVGTKTPNPCLKNNETRITKNIKIINFLSCYTILNHSTQKWIWFGSHLKCGLYWGLLQPFLIIVVL